MCLQGRIEPGLQVGVIGPHQTDPGMAYLDGDAGNARRQIIPFSPEEILKNAASPQNIALQHLDTLEFVSRREIRQNFVVNVSGAVRKEGEYVFAEGLTLKDALYWSGGMTEEAANNRIEISRLVTHSATNQSKSLFGY